MNHHLRFLVSFLALSTTILIGTSCSTNSPPASPPEVALEKGQIRYRLHIFSTDETVDVLNSFPNSARIAGIYSSDEGAKLLQRYQKNKQFQLNTAQSLIGREGEKISYTHLTPFRFPTEYDPPVYRKTPGSFPITPATPSKFETKQLGTRVYLTGRKVSAESLSLSINFEKRSFLENVNHGTPITSEATDFWGRKVQIVLTENKILVPVFRNFKLDSEITLLNGHCLLIEGNGSPSKTTNKRLDKSTGPVQEANFVALIQIEAAP
ncbi:hypothetical protein N9A94_03685 [Akkermansiaceae bacterium]|nr:hypothetical protein [Akkermansiaceae bacterium]MDB4544408.1 hypothetical protein [Akkermansiaceae bacterium]